MRSAAVHRLSANETLLTKPNEKLNELTLAADRGTLLDFRWEVLCDGVPLDDIELDALADAQPLLRAGRRAGAARGLAAGPGLGRIGRPPARGRGRGDPATARPRNVDRPRAELRPRAAGRL